MTTVVFSNVRFLWTRAMLFLFAGMMVVGGSCACQRHAINVPNIGLPAAGASVERVAAHVQSAERLNNAAKTVAGKEARPLLDQTSAEHEAAGDALTDTRKDLATAVGERDALVGKYGATSTELTRVKAGWGYRLQVWVSRVAWLLVGAGILHVVLGAAALFIPGGGGAILAKIAVALNPAAWWQSARDNYWFRVRAKEG